MSWIKSHSELEHHPKMLRLMRHTKWDIDTAVGKLHRFWWWVTKYAPDGDLSKKSPEDIALALNIPDAHVEEFLSAMQKSEFIEAAPYLRVHDWWEHAGKWLQGKNGRSPEKWQRVKDAYCLPTGGQQLASSLPTGGKLLPIRGEEIRGEKTTDKAQTLALNGPIEPQEAHSEDLPGNSVKLPPPLPPSALMALWNNTADVRLPRVSKLTQPRITQAKARIKECPEPEFWQQAISGINASLFCLGENKTGWKATFDWILRPGVAVKIVEGQYGGGKQLVEANSDGEVYHD